MKFSEVSAEIRAVVESLDDHDRRDLAHISARVLDNHQNIEGDDKDFHLCCSYRAVRHEVRTQLNRERADTSQLALEGFEHLQASYDIERNGREEHIPLAEASDDELMAKADELDAMSGTLREHATELRRYVILRNSPQPSLSVSSRKEPAAEQPTA